MNSEMLTDNNEEDLSHLYNYERYYLSENELNELTRRLRDEHEKQYKEQLYKDEKELGIIDFCNKYYSDYTLGRVIKEMFKLCFSKA